MSEVAEDCPFVKYNNYREGNNEMYVLKWIFPDYQRFLESTRVHEVCTVDVGGAGCGVSSTIEPASKFQLKMLLLGKNKDFIELYYLAATATPVFLKYEVRIWYDDENPDLDPDNIEDEYAHILDTKGDLQTMQTNVWQYIGKFCKSDLLNGHDYCVELKVTVPDDGLQANKNAYLYKPEDLQLIKDYGNLLSDEKSSDVTLKSAEGEELKAHKSILIARCEVLKAHFKHNTAEALTNVIETPLESKVLREMLTYIYSARTPHIDEFPEKLLAAADYYQLSVLKNLCEEALLKKITVENAVYMLQLADLHSANSLKQSTLEFIQNGHADLIIETEGWKNLQSAELLKAIFVVCVVSGRSYE